MFEIRRRGLTADFVTIISLIGLIAIAIVVIVGNEILVATNIINPTINPTILVLAAVLPLIATWVGGAIAYSFSSSNFALALNAAGRFAPSESIADERPITDVFIERKQFVESFTLGTAKDISIQKLLDTFRPEVARIPVFHNNGAIAYVVHELTAHKFFTKLVSKPPPGLKADDANLDDLLKDEQSLLSLTSYVVVSCSCKVSEARKMIAGACKDVFVTQDGRPGCKVLGWLTDTQLAERIRS
jgi:hypothetical protein